MTAIDVSGMIDAVGARLRALRMRHDFTLTELSERTGISVSTLSRLEAGERRASLDLLLPIATVFDVGLDALVGVETSRDPRVHGTPITRHGRTWVALSRHGDGPTAFKVTVPAAPAKHRVEQRVHAGFDWFFVLSGRVRLALGDDEHIIEAGEAVEFDTLIPHGTASAGSGPAEILHLMSRDGERVHLRDV
ncbi:XRE family transcriptional regulator [Microbacterium horticulturae]|uniref:XRE family transcriptional regulator n=1 Tax=Microbacterium horticulturae TaxID=3028316 RepID=A0ABY8BX92_9MICO|nr:XRE family transcriptional regulator [Microbacterium sp. KACC 23027]WEG08814.1 XRE family transcriptional regulator [Microbacterium sp. KACC 23027]